MRSMASKKRWQSSSRQARTSRAAVRTARAQLLTGTVRSADCSAIAARRATAHLDNYQGWFRSLDNHNADSGEGALAMALGKFPHLTVT